MKEKSKIQSLNEIIKSSKYLVFFGGAGVSTDSGIKDFRGKDGLYKEKFAMPAEYYLSSNCFYNDIEVFYDFYKNKMNCLNIKPNIVHKYLAKLEKEGILKGIITQNIDGLHQKAGSKKVYEIHGTIYSNHCTKCNKKYSADFVFNSKEVPKCTCGKIIKPDVVLYGESLNESFNKAISLVEKADTLIVAGTSLTVYPASSLVDIFKGKNLVILNEDKTPYDYMATLVINDNLSETFTKLDSK